MPKSEVPPKQRIPVRITTELFEPDTWLHEKIRVDCSRRQGKLFRGKCAQSPYRPGWACFCRAVRYWKPGAASAPGPSNSHVSLSPVGDKARHARSTSFATAIEDPDNFKKSRSVGAWLGLTTRRYQSGEVDYDGYISRRGDGHLRGLLYEAATLILTRSSADSGASNLGRESASSELRLPSLENWR